MTRPMLSGVLALSVVGLLTPVPATAQPGMQPEAALASPRAPGRAWAPVVGVLGSSGPMASAAWREAARLAAQAADPAPAQEQSPKRRGWISRHPILFSFMVGAAAGAVIGGADPGPEARGAAMSEGALIIGGLVALPVAMVVGIREESKGKTQPEAAKAPPAQDTSTARARASR